jgi:hypothetical protein
VEEIGPYSSHIDGLIQDDSVNNLYGIDPLLVNPAAGDFHLRYDSPGIDSATTLKFATIRWLPMPATDFEGNTRFKDGDADGETAADIGAYEYVPNLPGLRAFLTALSDAEEIDATLAARLLVDVDTAAAALAQDQESAAVSALNELIADVRKSLSDTETAQLIEMKTKAVIEEI